MMRGVLLWAWLVASAWGQTSIDLRTQSKSVDFSAASSSRPWKTGTALPAQCSVGDSFFKTDAPAGQNLYACTVTNVWTLLSGSGGGGGAGLPPMAGNANRLLSNNGTSADWRGVGVGLSVNATSLTIDTVTVPQKDTTNSWTQANTFQALLSASGAGAVVDFAGAAATRPIQAGLSSMTPGSCIATQEMYIKTDAPAGQQLFLCNALGTGFQLLGIQHSTQTPSGDALSAGGTFATNYLIPAGTLAVGKTVEILAGGSSTTDGSGAQQFRFAMRLCTVSGCATGTVVEVPAIGDITVGANETNASWFLRVAASAQSSGAAGVLVGQGESSGKTGATTTASSVMGWGAGVTVDTTVNQYVQIRQINALSGDSSVLRQLVVRIH